MGIAIQLLNGIAFLIVLIVHHPIAAVVLGIILWYSLGRLSSLLNRALDYLVGLLWDGAGAAFQTLWKWIVKRFRGELS